MHTFVACGFEQLVQLAQVSAAEAVVVAHEDLQGVAGGGEAQGCCEQGWEGEETHFGDSGPEELDCDWSMGN